MVEERLFLTSNLYTMVCDMNELAETSHRTRVARDPNRCITIWLDIQMYHNMVRHSHIYIYIYVCMYVCMLFVCLN